MSDPSTPIGPNVKRLIVHKMSADAIPPGSGIAEGLEFLRDPKRIIEGNRKATEWVQAALAAIKAAPDNPYGYDDEAIAGEILRQIDERRAKAKTAPQSKT